jgi:hypothetical protein
MEWLSEKGRLYQRTSDSGHCLSHGPQRSRCCDCTPMWPSAVAGAQPSHNRGSFVGPSSMWAPLYIR